MLVDLTPHYPEIERRKIVSIQHGFEWHPQYTYRIETGIYQCGSNFSHEEFVEFKDDANISFAQSYEVFSVMDDKNQYGVADSIEQIKEYYKEEIENPNRKFFISVAYVEQNKSNKGKGGGWRWHKWGEYIGKLNPEYEYLDDEEFGDDFKHVICFHLYEVL